ncbi:calcium-binding protein [Mycoplana rhizolycopersici]|uniref:Calcium-binding protein n=1 Tax=Mycoplana rhizolycopersici TaxID=2746702 RepID=A0ABX2QJ71_9HYPH|nr:calcium-binding protein [Rhizobium rhizolycopersici]NVP57268.1 calcium-binding protein [Rhizobium rhizolycopersici]
MTKKIVITANRTTAVSVPGSGTELVVNAKVTVDAAATALIATGKATDRAFYINGTLVSASGYAVEFGAKGVDDSESLFVIGKTGKVSGKANGMDIRSGGLELVNHGTIEAAQTTLSISGAATKLVNNGLVSSFAGSVLKALGKSEMVINNGSMKAVGDALMLSGSSASLTNNGEVVSTKAHAVVSSASSAVLTNHGTLKGHTDAIVSTGKAVTITSDGLVASTKGSAIIASGAKAIVTNNDGTLKAAKNAVVVSGDGSKVTNNGSISSSAYAISVDADKATVTNNKTIKAAGGIEIDGGAATVSNYGTIHATKAKTAAVDFTDAAASTFHNYGLVQSTGTAFLGGSGVQSVFNSGTIKGSVILGVGNDYFDGTGGKVTGSVQGGKGNDVYVISDAATKLVERAGEGTDLVKSSVSLALGANFENLTLTGSANIKATGNSLANQLHGNSGNNVIKGGGGNDTIWGHGGNDILTGGGGSDHFVFASGDGKDTITDFTATGSRHDVLDLSSLASITSYADLTKNHMKQVGADVLIDGHNGDTILLTDVKIATLDKGDFVL